MKRLLAPTIACLALQAGCTYYQTTPATVVSVPSSPSPFERSWSAALGAFEDQGLRVTEADRSTGIIRGNRDGIGVTATLRTRADGGVRVELATSGNTDRDPELINRVHRSYDRRMGR